MITRLRGAGNAQLVRFTDERVEELQRHEHSMLESNKHTLNQIRLLNIMSDEAFGTHVNLEDTTDDN